MQLQLHLGQRGCGSRGCLPTAPNTPVILGKSVRQAPKVRRSCRAECVGGRGAGPAPPRGLRVAAGGSGGKCVTFPGHPRPSPPGHVGPAGQSLRVRDAEARARWARRAGSCCGCSSAVRGGWRGGRDTLGGQGPPRGGRRELEGLRNPAGPADPSALSARRAVREARSPGQTYARTAPALGRLSAFDLGTAPVPSRSSVAGLHPPSPEGAADPPRRAQAGACPRGQPPTPGNFRNCSPVPVPLS